MLNELEALARKTIADCTHVKQVAYADQPIRLLLPSGDEKYVAFWVRDAAMMAESGLVPDGDLRRYIEIIASCGQNGPDTLRLAHGLEVPPFAVADHVNYNGKPVFFPGTYADGEDQGDGLYGSYPPFCDNYYFISMVDQYVAQTGDRDILTRSFGGMTLANRLARAFEGYNLNPDTGLCVSEYRRFTVDWGFTDSVAMQGALLFASLLRYMAATAMGRLFPGSGYTDGDAPVTASLARAIRACFRDSESGWLWSSDGPDRQHDVWGTAYAVYLGVLDAPEADSAAQALASAYRAGTSGVNGYIRHILTTEDAVPGVTAWARCSVPVDVYQNGTYWATPLGWYAVAVDRVDHALALSMLGDFLAHTAANKDRGAPFEWISRDTERFSGCLYGTSGVLPYAGALRILKG